MKVIRSEYAGACYGVERALALVEEAVRGTSPAVTEANSEVTGTVSITPPLTVTDGAVPLTVSQTAPITSSQHASVHTLGPLIHNPQVVSELAARGVQAANTVDEVEAGILVLRSHGVAPNVTQQAYSKGLTVVDATCPHVSKAQQAARLLREQGYTVIVVGENGHPEVEAISAYAGDSAFVVQEPGDLPAILPTGEIGVVVQTTQSPAALTAIVDALRARGIEPRVKNTICFATRQRQQAAARLAQEVDVMVVVGGRNSGNTTRLYEICKEVSPRAYHIETPAELDPAWFKDAQKVGVTAGASTPENQITTVVEALESLGTTKEG